MNLCKFIVDREVACTSTRLGKILDAMVKNSFMKNINKLENPPDQLRIKHGMTVDKRKNQKFLQDIENEKNTSSNKDSKNFFL